MINYSYLGRCSKQWDPTQPWQRHRESQAGAGADPQEARMGRQGRYLHVHNASWKFLLTCGDKRKYSIDIPLAISFSVLRGLNICQPRPLLL